MLESRALRTGHPYRPFQVAHRRDRRTCCHLCWRLSELIVAQQLANSKDIFRPEAGDLCSLPMWQIHFIFSASSWWTDKGSHGHVCSPRQKHTVIWKWLLVPQEDLRRCAWKQTRKRTTVSEHACTVPSFLTRWSGHFSIAKGSPTYL